MAYFRCTSGNLKAKFKWQNWLREGGVNPLLYDDLDEVLEDELALRRLFLVHKSVDYMASFNEENEDVEKILKCDLAAKWINLSDYALDTLYANTVIKDYMDVADKYFYGEWALVGQVPTMTSNTAPYGSLIISSSLSGFEGYKAFDGNISTTWIAAANATNNYVGYTFVNPIKPSKARVVLTLNKDSSYTVPARTFKIQGSNDGFVSDVHDLATIDTPASSSDISHKEYYVDITSDVTYSSLRLFCADIIYVASQYSHNVEMVQFYSWQPKGNVPVMTSNTAPYGEASRSSVYDTQASPAAQNEPWHAFRGGSSGDNLSWKSSSTVSEASWIAYKFTNPVKAARVKVRTVNVTNYGYLMYSYKVQGSNDGVTYDDLYTVLSVSNIINVIDIPENKQKYYLYYRLYDCKHQNTVSGIPINYVNLAELQFYGRELSVSVPKMDGNTSPYGIAFSDQTDAYKAFDGSTSTHPTTYSATEHYWGYKFTDKVKVKAVLYYGSAYGITEIIQKASDINGTWTDVLDVSSELVGNTYNLFTIDSDEEQCWRLKMNNSSAFSGSVSIVNFYGLDYSEREFEEGTNKKWLYDHGLLLNGTTWDDTVVYYSSAYTRRGSIDDYSSYFRVIAPSTQYSYIGRGVNDLIDFTDYSLVRLKNNIGTITTVGLDVSSLNSSYYLAIFSVYAGSAAIGSVIINSNKSNMLNNSVALLQTNSNQVCDISELWLE